MKIFQIILIFALIIYFQTTSSAEKDIFDAVTILEYLSGEKIFSDSEISNFDVDCNCKITLEDVFIIIQNIQINICNTTCNMEKSLQSVSNMSLIEKIVKENEKIKNYKYNGNFIGNASNVKVNGTASGNYTFLISFDDIPFNATLELNSSGKYNGTYDRTNNTGFIDGNITTNGTITANVPVLGSITHNETTTNKLNNQTNNTDIYNISVNILKDNATKINISEEIIDNISCYKIIAIIDKSKGIEMVKNFVGNSGNVSKIGLSDITLNLNESNIKQANIIYWIAKENFSIIQEQLNIEIENFTQQINKTIEINKCKDNLCIKNITFETIDIKQANITSYVKFYNFKISPA